MKYRVVAFFAREHGLSGLRALLAESKYELVCLFTHRFKPKGEDPMRGERSEFIDYKILAEEYRIPIYSVDRKEDQQMVGSILEKISFDFIVSISWRLLIPKAYLDLAKIGSVNVHRGLLPNYPGAEPIKQALLHGDNQITITAHEMVEEIDAGKPLAFCHHLVNYDQNHTLEENISRLKNEITSHFGPLLIKALNTITN